MFIIKFCPNMFRASLCPSSGEKEPVTAFGVVSISCLLLTSVSTCFGHHYAHLQENKELVTAFGVVSIRCLLLTSVSTCFGHHYAHLQENKEPVTAFGAVSI